jgi:hypothetical protein
VNARLLTAVAIAAAAALVPAKAQDPIEAAQDRLVKRLASLLPDGLTIAPKTFDAKDGNSALGFEYTLRRQFRAWDDALVVRADATGNVAFDETANPDDFLDTKLSIGFAKNFGGVKPNDWSPEHKALLADKRMELAGITDPDELDAAFAEQEALVDSLTSQLTNQLYVEAGATGGVENDQAFSERQWTLGAQFGAKLNLWEPASRKWNVFDWPFAIVRALGSKKGDIELDGDSFPYVLAGLDLVDPDSTSLRAAAGDSSEFLRLRLEAGMTAALYHGRDFSLKFEAAIRHYQELDAETSTEAADLDQFTWVAVGVRADNGFYVRYSTGRLPLDAIDDDVYELGFSYKF